MNELCGFDMIVYVCFVLVYCWFEDVFEFVDVIEEFCCVFFVKILCKC